MTAVSKRRTDIAVGPYALPASPEVVARELISDLQIAPFLYLFSPKHRLVTVKSYGASLLWIRVKY